MSQYDPTLSVLGIPDHNIKVAFVREGGHRMLPPLPNLLPPFAKDVAAFCQPGYH
ncbi:hypothetical protein [Lacticaseibacillus paracasei]|uniref:hypothetical protein n=1 Tax=Lacticaseibacillus paracasei TaxID=1597 RepID=UPI0013ECDD40|nr:hypothetical protein [Lacticaseibacillus paracasei]